MCGKKGEFHEVVGEGDDHSAREGILHACLPARVVVKCYLKRHDVSEQFDQFNPTPSHYIKATLTLSVGKLASKKPPCESDDSCNMLVRQGNSRPDLK